MTKYTDISTLQDIIFTHSMCGEYIMRFWNYVDREYCYLRLTNTECRGNNIIIYFETCSHSALLKNLGDYSMLFAKWKTDKRIVIDITNHKNKQKMYLVYSGYDHRKNVIDWTLMYCDPSYHKWKLDLYTFFTNTKYRLYKLFKGTVWDIKECLGKRNPHDTLDYTPPESSSNYRRIIERK
jgi:hypothetical protein